MERDPTPLPTKLDKEFGRTVTIDPRGGWKEVYCHTGPDGSCACSPHTEQHIPPIAIDDPDCRKKIIELGIRNRQISTP